MEPLQARLRVTPVLLLLGLLLGAVGVRPPSAEPPRRGSSTANEQAMRMASSGDGLGVSDGSEARVEAMDRAALLKVLSNFSGDETNLQSLSMQSLHRMALERMLAASPEECDLCEGRQDWLFVLATGRSGSTSILQMLNAIPGFFIAGENFGVMNGVMAMYDAAGQLQEYRERPAYRSGPISENKVLCALQLYVRKILGYFDEATTSVIGFKEIRHHRPLELEIFTKVFPCARYIVNTRLDVQEQHKSQFKRTTPVWKMQQQNNQLEKWQSLMPDIRFLLRLEDFSLEYFDEMLAWLGVSDCHYTDVAHANLQGYNADTVHGTVVGSCSVGHWSIPSFATIRKTKAALGGKRAAWAERRVGATPAYD